MRFGIIFKAPVLRLARRGALNIHPGSLPCYPGLFSPFYAMLADEPTAGCTLHVMDEGIDTGPVIGIRHLPIDPHHSLFWHLMHLYPLGVELFLQTLTHLEAGRALRPQPQDRSQRAYRSLPSPEQFAAFRAKKLRLVDPEDYREFLGRFCQTHTF